MRREHLGIRILSTPLTLTFNITKLNLLNYKRFILPQKT
jgi:hypothetical protein